MRTTTILIVLLSLIGMAIPAFGAVASSEAGANANWDWASQYSNAWAETDDGDEYVNVGSAGFAEGFTTSSSAAMACDDCEFAYGGTGGYSESWNGRAGTYSYGYAQENDPSGETETGSSVTAVGDTVIVSSDSGSFWGPPIYSYSDVSGITYNGYTYSSAYGIATDN